MVLGLLRTLEVAKPGLSISPIRGLNIPGLSLSPAELIVAAQRQGQPMSKGAIEPKKYTPEKNFRVL